MDIHKPKAAHSWREFLIEIGTIICGILIALGLEQVVQTVEWSRRVAETREALGQELAENLWKADERAKLSACVQQRLDALAEIVDRSSETGVLPPLPAPQVLPYRSWATGVWTSALNAQTAAHLPPKELRAYARLYQLLGRIAEVEPQEEAVWTTLFGLAGPGRAFDREDARLYRQAIGQARQFNGLMSGFAVRSRQVIDGNHLGYAGELYASRAHFRAPDCGPPRGEPPRRYGAAPAADFGEAALRRPVS